MIKYTVKINFSPVTQLSVNKLNYFMLHKSKIVSAVKMVYKASIFQLVPGHQIRYTLKFFKLFIVKNIKTMK